MDVARGRLLSVNVAVVRTDERVRGKTGRSGIDKRSRSGPVPLHHGGVDGDTICDVINHGGPDQAVYAYASEDLAYWSAELDQPFEPGGVGENLTMSGVDCSGAVIGERWQVGSGALLTVRGPRFPCQVFANFRGVRGLVKRFIQAGRPGCYLSVAEPGAVQAGDAVRVFDRPGHGVTVADVLAGMAGDRDRVPAITAARDDLGERGRVWLDKTLYAMEGSR